MNTGLAAARLRVARHPNLRGIDGARVIRDGERVVVDLHFVPPAPDVTKSAVPRIGAPGALLLEGAGARAWSIARVEPARDDAHAVRVVFARAPGAPPPSPDPVVIRLGGLSDIAPGFDSVTVRLAPASRADDVTALQPPPARGAATPEIDYLAKDYAGFRRLMLDRIAMALPAWTEQHAADEGITIVELLAYAADYLSYYQDAVATEAYLNTARRRTSVRRHARLLGYRMHEGCVPRVWLHFDVDRDGTLRPGIAVRTGDPATGAGTLEFRTLEPATLYQAKNEFAFFAYGSSGYTLPAGATSAALLLDPAAAAHAPLQRGDVLILEQAASPLTGRSEDADARLRQAVRLTATPRVTTDPVSGATFCEIVWHVGDALAFDLPVVRRIGPEQRAVTGLARALGNNVPADFGERHVDERLPAVGERAPYAPRLAFPDITFAVPYDHATASRLPASAFTTLKPYKAVPQIVLEQAFTDGNRPKQRWTAARDLLAASRDARVFAIEIDDARTPALRFGDGVHGRRPEPGSRFTATYRVGNGPATRLGHDVLVFAIADADLDPNDLLTSATVTNPLRPGGGALPQPVDEARRAATATIRAAQRAVIAADFARAAKELPGVRAAAADTAFTGSWSTTRLFVQRVGGEGPETRRFLDYVRDALERYRTAGTDLVVLPPSYVDVQVELEIFGAPHAEHESLRARVDAAIAELLAREAFSFGDRVHASPFVAAAMGVPGVRNARVTRLARAGAASPAGVEPPPVPMGTHEIARVARCRVGFRGREGT